MLRSVPWSQGPNCAGLAVPALPLLHLLVVTLGAVSKGLVEETVEVVDGVERLVEPVRSHFYQR